jgi:hypothetical protein
MLPLQFNAPGNFVMVGNPQMDTVEARADAELASSSKYTSSTVSGGR